MLATGLLLVVILLLLFYLGTRKPEGYPPGPKWWPIIGCIVEMSRIRKRAGNLCESLTELHKMYGNVVGLKIGNDQIVVLNDYESIKHVLTNEDCDGRPTGPLYEARTWGARRGLIVVDGHLWRQQRRFVLRHLREFGFGRTNMATIVEEEAQHLVEHFKRMLMKKNRGSAVEQIIKRNSSTVNNNHGQIYKLENSTISSSSEANATRSGELYGDFDCPDRFKKSLSIADMYVKAEEYVEIRRMSQSSGMIITMHDAFGISVLNALWKMMAGKRFNTDDQELSYLQRILTKLLREVDMIGAPFSHFPFLRFIAPEMSGYKAYLETHQQLWKYLREELDNHKNTFDPKAPRDLMDVYLTVLQSKDRGDTFTESQLLAVCVDLFIAGSETTSKALAFCFLYMVLYPEVQRRAQEEIDRTIGRKRMPTLADRLNLTYMHAVVLEAIRLFMGRTLNVPHRTLKDVSIMGHRIPKDTMLLTNFNRILMDESWGDPEVFRPERFIDDNGSITWPEHYIPFSIGRHRCMGETLAKCNIFVITTALLQTFTFSVVPGEKRPSEDYLDGVTATPHPYRVLLSLRT